MATVFLDKIVQKIYESPTQGGLQAAAQKQADKIFDSAVKELQEEFEASPVTQEIDRGIGSPNISHTLRGGDAPENLYSFIGFPEGEEPTKEIRERLNPAHEDGPKLALVGKDRRTTSIRYQFKASAPKEKELWAATPLPWAEDLSWAKKIEEGIQGFASFLPRFMGDPSRSGGGIQAKGPNGELRELRKASYVPPLDGYLQTMFKNFLSKFKRNR